MRTDAQIDKKPVRCPYASHLGWDKWVAEFGDIIEFRPMPLESGCTMLARVAGRIAYAPALGETPEIRNFLLVVVLYDGHFSGIRWIDPCDVTRIFDPNRKGSHIAEFIRFFYSPEFREYTPAQLVEWSESGFATPELV